MTTTKPPLTNKDLQPHKPWTFEEAMQHTGTLLPTSKGMRLLCRTKDGRNYWADEGEPKEAKQ